jgi:hypothetical protein
MVPERFVEVEERLYHLVKHCKYFLGHDASMPEVVNFAENAAE